MTSTYADQNWAKGRRNLGNRHSSTTSSRLLW